MGINVARQREIGVVFLAFGGNGLCDINGLRESAFAEERVGEIEFHVVGIGIGLLRRIGNV